MELNVKAVSASATAWRGGEVTRWRPQILLEDDIWSLHREADLRYHEMHISDGRTLYVAQDHESGFSSFYVWDRSNETGFGGREIPIKLVNGATIKLKGPWSSNSYFVNEMIDVWDQGQGVLYYVAEVSYYSGGDWRNVGMAAAITVPKLKELVEEFMGKGWHLAWDSLGDSDLGVELHNNHLAQCERRVR